jgi:hypothetical protein
VCSGSAPALFSNDLIERGIKFARGEFLSAFYLFSAIPPVGIPVAKNILLLLLFGLRIFRRLVS